LERKRRRWYVISGFAPPRPEADRGADEVKAVAVAGAIGADGASGDTAPDPIDTLVEGALSTRATEKAKAKA